MEQVQLPVPAVPKRKRGRPRKTVEDTTNRNISNNIMTNSISEKTVDTKYMTRSKNERYTRDRRITITNYSELNDLTDNSSVEDRFVIKKRDRPGRGRRGRRGRGRRVLQSSLDKEYIPSSEQNNDFTSIETEDNKSYLEDVLSKPNLEINIDNNKTSLTDIKCTKEVSILNNKTRERIFKY